MVLQFLYNSLHTAFYQASILMGLNEKPVRKKLKSLGGDARKMSPHALNVVKKLSEAGYETYLVGGCIRDLLCKQEPKDFDIATAATPEKVKKVFGRKARIIGRRFRIVHVIEGGELIEVSTFRAKESAGSKWFSGKQNNNVYGTSIQDVWRRDFSCNALFYNAEKQEVIDYVGGLSAIKKRSVDMIGVPKQRLIEDPVRILRAIRFRAKTQFTIEPSLELAIRENANLLKKASADRLLIEVTKLFYHGHGVQSWHLLKEYGIINILFPGMAKLDEKKHAHHLQFIERSLQSTDKRYQTGQYLSTGYLFAVLLWPLFMERLQEKKGPQSHVYYHKCMEEVLKQEGRVVSIPKRLQEAIIMIWQLQSDFKKKIKQANKVVKSPRFKAAYDFLVTLAQVDEREVQTALMWRSHAMKARNPRKEKGARSSEQ